MPGTGNLDLRAYPELAELEVPNFGQPDLDPSTMALTFPVAAEWLSPQRLAWRVTGLAIDGVARAINDAQSAGVAFTANDATLPNIAFNRYYSTIFIQIAGGVGAARELSVDVKVPNAAGAFVGYTAFSDDAASTYRAVVGPVLCRPQEVLEVFVRAVAGADTIAVFARGVQTPPGIGMPLNPATASRVTP